MSRVKLVSTYLPIQFLKTDKNPTEPRKLHILDYIRNTIKRKDEKPIQIQTSPPRHRYVRVQHNLSSQRAGESPKALLK